MMMDIQAARRSRGTVTRKTLGFPVTIRPMIRGKMKMMADGSRPVLTDVPARFDTDPGLEDLGAKNQAHAPVATQTQSVTIDRVSLEALPMVGDRVEFLVDGSLCLFEIVRIGRDGNAILILFLSKV